MDTEWKKTKYNVEYTPAPSCPFCRGKILYLHEGLEYYMAGHEANCALFGSMLSFKTFEDMKEKWERRV